MPGLTEPRTKTWEINQSQFECSIKPNRIQLLPETWSKSVGGQYIGNEPIRSEFPQALLPWRVRTAWNKVVFGVGSVVAVWACSCMCDC